MVIKLIWKGILFFYLYRKVSTTEGANLAKKEGLLHFEVSAKTGQFISHMFYNAIAELSFFDQFDFKSKEKLVEELRIFIFIYLN